MRAALLLCSFGLIPTACGSGGGGDADAAALPDAGPVPPATDWTRDILDTRLAIDITAMAGVATITLAGSGSSSGASFEIGDLTIRSVTDAAGAPLAHRVEGARLDVGIAPGPDDVDIVVTYDYALHAQFEGVMASGLTLTWPYWCGNVFPCNSQPAEGTRFELALTGVPPSLQAVYPQSIPGDAPAYMAAWAIGDYAYTMLGTTGAGTEVGAWTRPMDASALAAGTGELVSVVDWLERELGDYLFGDRVASVSAPWGAGAYGGMEHHPLWHVASAAFGDREVHAHEAAHGWFGNGVRVACWEDFVLSEGTVTYLAARVLGQVAGPDAEAEVWTGYQGRLDRLQAGSGNKIAWPAGCGDIDILDGLFGDAPYYKGAFFFRAVAEAVGADVLDAGLASFYQEHRGEAATMQQLLDHLADATGWDPMPCALAWLRAEPLPAADACQ